VRYGTWGRGGWLAGVRAALHRRIGGGVFFADDETARRELGGSEYSAFVRALDIVENRLHLTPVASNVRLTWPFGLLGRRGRAAPASLTVDFVCEDVHGMVHLVDFCTPFSADPGYRSMEDIWAGSLMFEAHSGLKAAWHWAIALEVGGPHVAIASQSAIGGWQYPEAVVVRAAGARLMRAVELYVDRGWVVFVPNDAAFPEIGQRILPHTVLWGGILAHGERSDTPLGESTLDTLELGRGALDPSGFVYRYTPEPEDTGWYAYVADDWGRRAVGRWTVPVWREINPWAPQDDPIEPPDGVARLVLDS